MKQKFSWDEHLNILSKCNELEEIKTKSYFYLRSTTPQNIYKYMYFESKDIIKRVEQLGKGQVWFSKKKKLNDPNDLIVGKLDDAESISYYKGLCEQTEIACFTGSSKNKLMWSHYAHGYEGICVCYKIKNSGYLVPVVYVNKRPNFTEAYKEFLARKQVVERAGKYYIDDKELTSFAYKTKQLFFLKEKVWAYEKEYRAVKSCEIGNEYLGGSLYDLEEIGLEISKIYCGFRCDKRLIAELKEMCRYEYEERLKKQAQWSHLEGDERFIEFLKQTEKPIELYEVYYDDNLRLKEKRI